MTDSPTLHCSFCGKSQDEVRKLIAGPDVYICDECVDLCNDIIFGEAPSVIRPLGMAWRAFWWRLTDRIPLAIRRKQDASSRITGRGPPAPSN